MFFSFIAASFIVGASYYSPYAWRLHCVSNLRRQVAAKRALILTYDDGPSNSTTPALLTLLRHHNAKATFFMLGRSARQNPAIANRILEEGHDVGCHSDQHLNAWSVDPLRAVSDINAGYKTLLPWVPPNGMYRPPYGKMTLPTYWAIRRLQAPVGWWTIDAGDACSRLPEPKHVADRLRREGGGVILMHDLDRSIERNQFVIDTTALLLDVAAQEAFRVERLSTLCE